MSSSLNAPTTIATPVTPLTDREQRIIAPVIDRISDLVYRLKIELKRKDFPKCYEHLESIDRQRQRLTPDEWKRWGLHEQLSPYITDVMELRNPEMLKLFLIKLRDFGAEKFWLEDAKKEASVIWATIDDEYIRQKYYDDVIYYLSFYLQEFEVRDRFSQGVAFGTI